MMFNLTFEKIIKTLSGNGELHLNYIILMYADYVIVLGSNKGGIRRPAKTDNRTRKNQPTSERR